MTQFSRIIAALAVPLAFLMSGCDKANDKSSANSGANKPQTASSADHTPPASSTAAAKAPAAEAVDPKEEAEIKENLAKLSPEDRKLAEAQRFCPIEEERRLGSSEMGKPMKLEIKGKTVFICCGGCKKEALANPDKTLAKVEELKAKNSAATK
jgi:hypothetical protein